MFPNIPQPLINWSNMQVGATSSGPTSGFDQLTGSIDEYPGDDSKVIWLTDSNGGPLDEEEGFYLHS